MPDSRKLKVGDRVRFVELPTEWSEEHVIVPAYSLAFMKRLIARGRSSRVSAIRDGFPETEVRLSRADGGIDYHFWTITESTGWCRVRPRR